MRGIPGRQMFLKGGAAGHPGGGGGGGAAIKPGRYSTQFVNRKKLSSKASGDGWVLDNKQQSSHGGGERLLRLQKSCRAGE